MNPLKSKDSLQQILMIVQVFVFSILILYLGKTLLIPLSFSLLISFILYPVCKWLENKGINRGVAITLPVFLVIMVLGGLSWLLISQLMEFTAEWINIKGKLLETVQQVSLLLTEKLGLSTKKQAEMLNDLANNAGNKVFSILGSTASSFSEGLFFLMMIPIFSSLILLYRNKLANALYQFFPSESQSSIYEILTESIHTYYNFIKGMAIVYLVVGILNSIGLALIGVPHPVLFGCIAAILTFIPYVGIMIASLLPITVAWVTYNSIWYPLAVVFVFGFVQTLEAYLIFPLAVGKKLKINTLIVFIMIIFGGMLWGAAGMILLIPMVSIVKLIADKSPKLRYLSELLGE
ncbi:MAG: AI-2E family transporter [Bacteroidia bacterium]|nr:AI-2E family transporter [Bacteroidia bacterium]